MMHHGLWIRRKWRDLLPILNQVQKALTNKTSDLSEVCERNLNSVDFLLTIAEARKAKKVGQQSTIDDVGDSSSNDDDPVEDMDYDIAPNGLQSKWSDDDE